MEENDEDPKVDGRADHVSSDVYETQPRRLNGSSVLQMFGIKRKSSIERDPLEKKNEFDAIAKGELFGISLTIRIPFTQYGPGMNGTVKLLFVIRCTMAPPENAINQTPLKTWEVSKSFSDFVQLDKQLHKILWEGHPGVPGIEGLGLLPPRHFLHSSFDEKIIEERKQGFLIYLQTALTAAFFFDALQPDLAKFLECPGVSRFGKFDARASNESDSVERKEGY